MTSYWLLTAVVYVGCLVAPLALVLLIRLWYLTPGLSGRKTPALVLRENTCRVGVLLGSGGHTSEMLALLESMDATRYSPRIYLVTQGDTLSEERTRVWEGQRGQQDGDHARIMLRFVICQLPRARNVGQSFLTAPWSVLQTAYSAAGILWHYRPDLIVCNGPGTCVPVCVIALIYRALWLCPTRTLYVESFARTSTLSLTGRILYPLVDNFVVQWPELQKRYPRALYRGVLV
ncbi:oligosaccharide biosynthesis protein Alg14 like-domain-containing protein [Thamnocephalis sphaerospora]|uniref:UDP-N-acetylglucosamine transferase subunit ALG14 n=1 Tax=Thamnocephalis sphaerospora TaxID=78915 RepID=A0A4P9XRL0_9FUNG|nr:oligosaccharide biosynthesis protein Alg14 like-domain-containing protein [Thamnocephalis sphaerospora]|eukprot:RKP08726.1 oligosaccharide biosynthesis protein Alg14 like-domain-containing protein [Thamnocephalis sphaerospora]